MNDKDTITVPGDFVVTSNLYPKGWKALQFSIWERPKGLHQWIHFLWGWDIFYGSFPLIKSLLAANILVWIILITTTFIK